MFPSGQFWCPHVPNSKRSREEGGSSDGARDGGKVGRKEGRRKMEGRGGRRKRVAKSWRWNRDFSAVNERAARALCVYVDIYIHTRVPSSGSGLHELRVELDR